MSEDTGAGTQPGSCGPQEGIPGASLDSSGSGRGPGYRQTYEMGQRGSLWLPAVIGTIKRNDGTLTLHRRVAHLELRRRLGDGAGGKDLWIGELRIETNRAAMNDSCGSGKAIHIYIPKPFGTHAKAAPRPAYSGVYGCGL
eukprot:scaffold10498_cov180-Isochrysis_galbana.AAC.1